MSELFNPDLGKEIDVSTLVLNLRMYREGKNCFLRFTQRQEFNQGAHSHIIDRCNLYVTPKTLIRLIKVLTSYLNDMTNGTLAKEEINNFR